MKVCLVLLASLFVIVVSDSRPDDNEGFEEEESRATIEEAIKFIKKLRQIAQGVRVALHGRKMLEAKTKFGHGFYRTEGPPPAIKTPEVTTPVPVTKSAAWLEARDTYFTLKMQLADETWQSFTEDGRYWWIGPDGKPKPGLTEEEVAAENARRNVEFQIRRDFLMKDINEAYDTICNGKEHSCVMPEPWLGPEGPVEAVYANPWTFRIGRSLSLPPKSPAEGEDRASDPRGPPEKECGCAKKTLVRFPLTFKNAYVPAVMTDSFESGVDIINALVDPDVATLLKDGEDKLRKRQDGTCLYGTTERVRITPPGEQEKGIIVDVDTVVKSHENGTLHFEICKCKRHASQKECGLNAIEYLSSDAFVDLIGN